MVHGARWSSHGLTVREEMLLNGLLRDSGSVGSGSKAEHRMHARRLTRRIHQSS